MITLGVADLSRARTFYERLGWRGQEVEETVFFQAGGMAVILWARHKLAGDAGVEDREAGGFGGLALAHNVRSRAEVDGVLAEAASAGAEITQAARETFYGGYAGYFTDPDGHAWEIAWNPGFLPGPDGSITVPDFGASSGRQARPRGCGRRGCSGCPVTRRAPAGHRGRARRTAGAPTPR